MNPRYWLSVAAFTGVALNTARLRTRLRDLAVIAPTDEPAHHSHVFLVADGVRLTAADERAASAHALREGLDVLDLVPGDLPPDRLVDLARMVDTTTYRHARLAAGRGAFQAVLIDREVLARAGLDPKDRTEVELVAAVARLKLYAPGSTGTAVLPNLRAAPRTGEQRFAVQRAVHAWEPPVLAFPVLRDAAVALGASAAPGWALATVALSGLQPLVVGAGRIRPRPVDLALGPVLRRRAVGEALADAARAVAPGRHPQEPGERPNGTRNGVTQDGDSQTGDSQDHGTRRGGAPRGADRGLARWAVTPPRGFSTADPDLAIALRDEYRAALADGVDRFLEAPRSTCPWCASTRLSPAFDGSDSAQGKPGRFHYDRCDDCALVFQNPRLSLAGLDFYYRDFYDGLGGPLTETIFGFSPDPYLARARCVPPDATHPSGPRSWLDVGAGHGHFCTVARDIWPRTTFDGLDIGAGIDEAARRGWVDHAYRGLFPELVDELAGRYDVISMFHYLEHTREPLAELDAAAQVLRPGGRLLIEVPNPQSPAARAYGQVWPGWLIPQHQQLIPADSLVAALEDRGLRVEELWFGETHQPGDAPTALWGLSQLLAPSPARPWRPDQDQVGHPVLDRARQVLGGAALAAALPAALVVDAATRGYLTRARRSNAYRVLARRA